MLGLIPAQTRTKGFILWTPFYFGRTPSCTWQDFATLHPPSFANCPGFHCDLASTGLRPGPADPGAVTQPSLSAFCPFIADIVFASIMNTQVELQHPANADQAAARPAIDGKTCWLLLEKSDETRISKGIDGYQDITGDSYRYDSLVPNHKQLKAGDVVVLRKEDNILGVGKVGSITEQPATKTHRRCPDCSSTDIRERIGKTPQWKCGKCAFEFSEPRQTTTPVRAYTAAIQGFARLDKPPTVPAVKSCAHSSDGPTSQLSILQLDPQKLRTVLEGIQIHPFQAKGNWSGQGLGLSPQERKAVEMHAIRVARKLYEDVGWTVVDKSNSHPFDLLATKDLQRRFIEVKGTTGAGQTILLTHGEVAHAKAHRAEAVLIVVAKVQLAQTGDEWAASGGRVTAHYDPWTITDAGLQPTQFRYDVVSVS